MKAKKIMAAFASGVVVLCQSICYCVYMLHAGIKNANPSVDPVSSSEDETLLA